VPLDRGLASTLHAGRRSGGHRSGVVHGVARPPVRVGPDMRGEALGLGPTDLGDPAELLEDPDDAGRDVDPPVPEKWLSTRRMSGSASRSGVKRVALSADHPPGRRRPGGGDGRPPSRPRGPALPCCPTRASAIRTRRGRRNTRGPAVVRRRADGAASASAPGGRRRFARRPCRGRRRGQARTAATAVRGRSRAVRRTPLPETGCHCARRARPWPVR